MSAGPTATSLFTWSIVQRILIAPGNESRRQPGGVNKAGPTAALLFIWSIVQRILIAPGNESRRQPGVLIRQGRQPPRSLACLLFNVSCA